MVLWDMSRCWQSVVMAVAQGPTALCGYWRLDLSHRCVTQPRPELPWSGISEALEWGRLPALGGN